MEFIKDNIKNKIVYILYKVLVLIPGSVMGIYRNLLLPCLLIDLQPLKYIIPICAFNHLTFSNDLSHLFVSDYILSKNAPRQKIARLHLAAHHPDVLWKVWRMCARSHRLLGSAACGWLRTSFVGRWLQLLSRRLFHRLWHETLVHTLCGLW